jgi:hypothetical protein
MINLEGEPYMGALALSDLALCKQLYLILQCHVGHSIKEISDLDLSHTL